jgi:hypothetical protein
LTLKDEFITDDEPELYTSNDEKWYKILKQFENGNGNKIIPEWILTAPISLMEKFWRGYVEVYAYCINEKYLHLIADNLNIAYSLQRIHLLLGKICDIIRPNSQEYATICLKDVTRDKLNKSFFKDDFVWMEVINNSIYETTVTTEEYASLYSNEGYFSIAPFNLYYLTMEDDSEYCVNNMLMKS